MFEQGRKSAPCLIFIDEIDAVGRQRGGGLGGGNDEREQTLNSLLVEMDGFDGHGSHHYRSYEQGRMSWTMRFCALEDSTVKWLLTYRTSRKEAILKVHAKKIKLCDDVELVSLARATAGFSGADLANLLNERRSYCGPPAQESRRANRLG